MRRVADRRRRGGAHHVGPGSSEVFAGSAVVYRNEAKASVLGVSRATLDGPGPVSEACALEMAAGTRKVYDTDLGLSLTERPARNRTAARRPGRSGWRWTATT